MIFFKNRASAHKQLEMKRTKTFLSPFTSVKIKISCFFTETCNWLQGRSAVGVRGAQFPGAESLLGRQITAGGA